MHGCQTLFFFINNNDEVHIFISVPKPHIVGDVKLNFSYISLKLKCLNLKIQYVQIHMIINDSLAFHKIQELSLEKD